MKDIKEQISELRNEFNRRIDRLEKELKPEFKVGQWVVRTYEFGGPHFEGKIFRITNIGITDVYEDDKITHMKDRIRPATPQEIESHLRSICDKYVGKKVRSLFCSNYIATISGYWKYDFEYDRLWYYGDDYNVIVYEEGRFADILPSLKPKPETKEQFIDFLMDWRLSDKDDKRFFDQYNIK